MNDRSIAVHAAVAYLLWPLGVILVGLGFLVEYDLGQVGIVLCMVGATLTVRGYFCAMHRRERNAFELGREYEQGLRRVR